MAKAFRFYQPGGPEVAISPTWSAPSTGLGTSYDFRDSKKAPSTATYILQPPKTTVGNLTELQSASTVPALAEYLASKK